MILLVQDKQVATVVVLVCLFVCLFCFVLLALCFVMFVKSLEQIKKTQWLCSFLIDY